MHAILDSVRSTDTQDGTVVLDIQGGRVFHLNRTASRVFQHLQEGRTELQIVQELSDEYSVPLETVEKDVFDLLESMKEAGILRDDARR